jgi:hypothetical protein
MTDHSCPSVCNVKPINIFYVQDMLISICFLDKRTKNDISTLLKGYGVRTRRKNSEIRELYSIPTYMTFSTA